MNILVESKVPFLDGLLEPYAHVLYAHPDSITPTLVKDVDAMIVRTRTRCDATLLDGSRCRFIGTATIGTDHID
ncbi:MAG: erythronate-4-phosphate dehydrogenase, partial [Muribaculaceae bacterium]|nr:erythronate-4-phosphate dehydrogenase [Muribaculaceae bacterium]